MGAVCRDYSRRSPFDEGKVDLDSDLKVISNFMDFHFLQNHPLQAIFWTDDFFGNGIEYCKLSLSEFQSNFPEPLS